MSESGIAEAEKVFQILIRGRVVEREGAQNRLMEPGCEVDRDYLRRRVLESLNGPFDVKKASADPRSQKAWVRCWLLSTLGRIADEDATSNTYVRQHTLISNEPNDWARYWALESLVVAGVADLQEVARGIVQTEDDFLAKTLALAILAREGDVEARERISEGIKRRDWRALRALRVVPVEEMVELICGIAAEPDFSNADAKYDSIVALGSIPVEWSASEKAITSLISCVKECRRHPWWDGMRSKALRALGSLKSAEAVPVLVAELSDSNPAIVYEAAVALEGAIGVDKATARVVEAASQTGEEAIPQYANALRWMDRRRVAEALESLMSAGSPEQQMASRALLSEVGGHAAFEKLRARADTMKQHLDALEKTERGIRELFDSSLAEARSGYRLSTLMDAAVFVLGVGFIILSGALVIKGDETLAGLTGAGGALGVLYNLFLSNPRRRVREAVEHLMSLKIIFLGYLRQLHQADKAFVRRFLDDSQLTPQDVKQYADIIAETMKEAVAQTQKEPQAPSA